MADFAQMIYGTAQQSAQGVGDGLAENFAKGAQLALEHEKIVQQGVALQQKKQELHEAKVDKLSSAIFKVQEFKDPAARKNYMQNYIPKMRDALGLQDKITDDALKAITVSDENMGRAYTLNLAVQKGELTVDDALGIWNDQEKFASVKPTPPELRSGDSTFSTSEAQKTFLGNQAQQVKLQQQAQIADTNQKATQGREDVNNRIQLTNKLNELGIPPLKSDLNKLDKLTGGFDNWKAGTEIPGVTGADAKIPMNQLKGKALATRQAAQGVANQILKLRSGAAINDGEASRLLNEIGMTAAIGEDGSWKTLFTGSPTSESFVRGMKGVRDKIGSMEQTLRAGYGANLYDQVVPPTGAQGQPQGAAPTAPDLSNPQIEAALKVKIQKNPANLGPIAASLKMTPDQLQRLLGLAPGGQ